MITKMMITTMQMIWIQGSSTAPCLRRTFRSRWRLSVDCVVKSIV